VIPVTPASTAHVGPSTYGVPGVDGSHAGMAEGSTGAGAPNEGGGAPASAPATVLGRTNKMENET
jgi:hypothetical protein